MSLDSSVGFGWASFIRGMLFGVALSIAIGAQIIAHVAKPCPAYTCTYEYPETDDE